MASIPDRPVPRPVRKITKREQITTPVETVPVHVWYSGGVGFHSTLHKPRCYTFECIVVLIRMIDGTAWHKVESIDYAGNVDELPPVSPPRCLELVRIIRESLEDRYATEVKGVTIPKVKGACRDW